MFPRLVRPTVQGLTLPERFDLFHRLNPHVADRLLEMAQHRVRLGRRRLSMKLLFEVLRDDAETYDPTSDYRLNNSYTAFYSRLLIERDPALAEVFETRRQVAA